jgi:peptidoglycan hydrolase FlgJ
MHVQATGNVSPVRNSGDVGLRSALAQQAESPLVKFEAFVLQDFVSLMLPADSENVYGKGLSGEMWQSLLAEKIAAQMAERGGIGIAARLLKDFHIEGEERLPLLGVSDPQFALSKGQSDALAKAMLQGLQTEKFGVTQSSAKQEAEHG